jgi:NAD(P)H-flavin reductase/ferredoxin
MTARHDVRLKSPETEVVCGDGQNILDAFLRANTWLPHGCSQGTCGSCKMQVLEGAVDHRDSSEFILTGAERAEGLALACQATPCSDLLVEPVAEVADDGVVRHPLRDVSGTVRLLEDIARETRRLVIDLEEPMPFTPGQYVELLVPGTDLRRQYSLANAPSETTSIELHVRRTQGGAATAGWIFAHLAVGDRVEVRGPMGVFGLGRPQEESAILVAGGTGLAPMKSIVHAALAERWVPELWLYHGGRTEEDLYDVEHLRRLDAEHEHFHYRPVLSEQEWDGATGMVTDAVLADFPTCKGLAGYLCGPPAMVEAGRKVFKRRRMAPRLIHREEFTDASTVAQPSVDQLGARSSVP